MNNKNLYIISKLIMAESVEEALKKEKEAKVSEIYIENDWRKAKIDKIIN